MKKSNKNFRRELMKAQQREAAVPRYPLNYDKADSVTLYSGDSITVSCSGNLFEPDTRSIMRKAF